MSLSTTLQIILLLTGALVIAVSSEWFDSASRNTSPSSVTGSCNRSDILSTLSTDRLLALSSAEHKTSAATSLSLINGSHASLIMSSSFTADFSTSYSPISADFTSLSANSSSSCKS